MVISIIGLLSSVVLSSLSGARKSAEATQAASNLNEVQKALESYMTDNGSLPSVPASGWAVFYGINDSKTDFGHGIDQLIDEGYLNSPPEVANFTNYDEFYIYELDFGSSFACGNTSYDGSQDTYLIGFVSGADPSIFPGGLGQISYYGSGSICKTNY